MVILRVALVHPLLCLVLAGVRDCRATQDFFIRVAASGCSLAWGLWCFIALSVLLCEVARLPHSMIARVQEGMFQRERQKPQLFLNPGFWNYQESLLTKVRLDQG